MSQHGAPPICPQCQEPGILEDGSPASFCLQCRFPLMAIAGKYRLERKIARGGSGTVYLARHLHLDDAYERVVKVLEVSEADEVTTRRFFREVQVTAKAANASDHIVRIYDDFGHEPFLGYYYVMEYLEGEDLGARLRREGHFELHQAAALFGQLCEAMSAAHDVGVVHRDLKPENILLVDKVDAEIVKVIDFGIARKMNTQQVTDPSRSLIGTPMYMSPEQCLNQIVDHRSDIYAMGLILYELLTGLTPFTLSERGPESSLMSVMYAHIHRQPPRLSERRPDLVFSDAIEEVLATALAKSPDDRFSSVEHMSDALLMALRSSGSSAFAHDSRTTIPDSALSPAHAAALEALQQAAEGNTEIELEAFAFPGEDEGDDLTSPALSVWDPSHDAEDHDPEAHLHSLDLLPDAAASPEPAGPWAQEAPQTPPLAASFPLNPLGQGQQTMPDGPTTKPELLLQQAEALVETRHKPEGASQFGKLEAMAPQLWALHDEHHAADPAIGLRALLALFPVVQASGDVQRFMMSLRALLKQPGLLATTLRIEAMLCLSQCHKLMGQTEDAARLLEDTLAMAGLRDAPLQKGHLLNLLGSVYRTLGKQEEARGLHQEALSLLNRQGDAKGTAQAHRYLANIDRARGLMDEAEKHLRASLQLCRQHQDRLGEGETLAHFGNLHRSQGHKEEAERSYSDAVVLYRELGDQRGLAITQSNLGHVLMKQGHYERAAEEYNAALGVFRQLKDRRSEAIALGHLGELQRRQGELQEARQHHQAAMSLHRQLGDRRGEAISYNQLGACLRDEGRLHEAASHHQQAAASQRQMQDKRGMGLTLFHQGQVELELDHLSEASERFDEAMDLLFASKALDGQCELLLYRGILYHMAGGIAAANDNYSRALGLADELRDLHLEARLLLFWVMLEAQRGELHKAQAAFDRASQLVSQLGGYLEPLVDIASACISLAQEQAGPTASSTQPQIAWELASLEHAHNTDHRLAQRLLRSALNQKRTKSDAGRLEKAT